MATDIRRKNWRSTFNLVGEAKVNDYTYKIDEKSNKSEWIYNSLHLGVDCGEKHGIIYADMMGGYASDRDNFLYVINKDADGNPDYENGQAQIHWDDRFRPEILSQIADTQFITVGLEKKTDGKTFYNKFLSPYDAIAYVSEHLTDGMVVRVRGTLQYSIYQGNTQVRKNINSIVLSTVTAEGYNASFKQSVLIDGDSANLKDIDTDKGTMPVSVRVLDYLKELNGEEIRGQYPFYIDMEYAFPDATNKKQCETIYNSLFKVKKDITQINFDGEFVESGAVVLPKLEDLDEDILACIEMGLYTEEEALQKCATNGAREKRMILLKPDFVKTDDKTVLAVYPERYSEEDLDVGGAEPEEEVDMSEVNSVDVSDADEDMEWLKALG